MATNYPPWPPFVTEREEGRAGELTAALWRVCCESGRPETMTEEFWKLNLWVRATALF